MANTAKRLKLDGEAQVIQVEGLAKHLVCGKPLLLHCEDLLESPCDWYFLGASSTGLRHVASGPSSPLTKCVHRFKSELKSWDIARVSAEASKALPDGDRILFRILMHANHPRYSPLTLALATPLLSALLALMEKGKVAGWPEKKKIWFSSWHALIEREAAHPFEAVADDSDNFSMQLADRGAASFVVQSMKQFLRCSDIQQQGCLLLSKLCIPKELAQQCCLLVMKSMEAFPDTAQLQKSACQAIEVLWRPGAQQQFLLTLGVVDAIKVLMERHTEHALQNGGVEHTPYPAHQNCAAATG